MPAKEYSPEVIAKSFIKQYYELMTTKPSELYRFYKDDSCFTHTEGSQAGEVISGTDKIRSFMRDLDVAGARFNLADGSVDAHRGESSGVIVLVTGFYTPSNDSTVRRFVQSFFLAVQSDSPAAYYVRNSLFRLLEPSAPTVSTGVSTHTEPAPSTVSTGVNSYVEVQPAVEVPGAPGSAHVKETVADAAEPVAPVGKESKRHRGKKDTQATPTPPPPPPPPAVVEPAPEPPAIVESVVVMVEDVTGEVSGDAMVENMALQQIGEQLAELAEEVVSGKEADTGPKSYADLFKRGKDKSASPPVAAAKKSKPAARPTAPPGGANGNASAKPAPAAAAAAPVTKSAPGSSLFVKQLPADITEGDLLMIFAGASKADIHSSKGYGFIEFPEPVFAASTMTRYQEDPSVFSHNGQRLRVEERTVQPKGAVAGKASGRSGNKAAADSEATASGKQSKGSGSGSRPGKGAGGGSKGEKGTSGWNVQGGKK